jgi:receptor protein-tyrosine kinase
VELREYLRVLRRHWKLIFISFVVCTGLAATITARAEPQYASTARLFVSSSPTTTGEAYAGGLYSADRVTAYADIASGQELARRVIDATGVDLTPKELAAKVRASPIPDTVLIEVVVTDTNPADAQFLAQSVSEQLGDFIAELETPPAASVPIIKATIVDPATLPTSPVAPKPARNVGIGILLGLVFGFGLSILREILDSSIKAPVEAERIAKAPVLGAINFDPTVTKKSLLTDLSSHAPRVEAFRVLRTNLQFVDVDARCKVFVVTSSVPGEGKSTTVTNLALTMAQAGQRVLLVDGDLRRPQVAELLGLESSVGLTTVLVGNVSLHEALQSHGPSGVMVLTSGTTPPNPAELLQSKAMHDLMATIRTEFDIVLIDSPPLLPVTDAALLSTLSDGAIMIVRHSKTTRDQLAGSRGHLASVDAKVLGVVFNMIPNRRGAYSYGYGYGYGYGYAPRAVAQKVTAGKRRAPEPEEETQAPVSS